MKKVFSAIFAAAILSIPALAAADIAAPPQGNRVIGNPVQKPAMPSAPSIGHVAKPGIPPVGGAVKPAVPSAPTVGGMAKPSVPSAGVPAVGSNPLKPSMPSAGVPKPGAMKPAIPAAGGAAVGGAALAHGKSISAPDARRPLPPRDEKGRFVSSKNALGKSVFVRANHESKIYHVLGCRYYNAPGNDVAFNSKADAARHGYRPCKVCASK